MEKLYQKYNNWVTTAIRPSPDDCPFPAPDCLVKGKPCTLRHVSIIEEEEFFKRTFFGELVSAIQKFREKYPLQDAQYLLPNAFISAQDRRQYQKQKKKRGFHLHLINDHTFESYDVRCDEFLSERCQSLGYVERPQNRKFIQKCKKIKKCCRLKKDDTFMNEYFDVGKFKQMTWLNLQRFNPWHINWVQKQFRSDIVYRQKARLIISRRDPVRRRREIQQMKQDGSFLDLYLGIGRYKDKTWREVESNDPAYIDQARHSTNQDWPDFAKIIKRLRIRQGRRLTIDSD